MILYNTKSKIIKEKFKVKYFNVNEQRSSEKRFVESRGKVSIFRHRQRYRDVPTMCSQICIYSFVNGSLPQELLVLSLIG